ncbi:MAG: YIP1 family protein, partial [Campylobacteraceae bacterium]|nr:YIP1 family protein [Campylobacteraceae bacterium]
MNWGGMKKSLLYPWIKIWNNPTETLQYMLNNTHPINLILLWFAAIFANSAYADLCISSENLSLWIYILTGIVVTLVEIVVIIVMVKIFGGSNINFKKTMILLLLSFTPTYFGAFLLHINSTFNSGLLSIWSAVLLVKFVRYAFGLSLWKSIAILFANTAILVLLVIF